MIPLRTVTDALHESLSYDTGRAVVAVHLPVIAFTAKFVPGPQVSVGPTVVFTPQFPRRTPIPFNIGMTEPPP